MLDRTRQHTFEANRTGFCDNTVIIHRALLLVGMTKQSFEFTFDLGRDGRE
jgi:hypothetical protein